MADSWYNISKGGYSPTDLRVLLVKSGYTFDADHDYVDDVVANECDFTNYERKALTSEAWSIDNANDRAKLDADDPATWSDAGGATDNELQAMIVFEYNAADASAQLVSCHETNIDGVNTNGGDLTIAIHANGIGLST